MEGKEWKTKDIDEEGEAKGDKTEKEICVGERR